MAKIVILGSGLAGLTAAMWLKNNSSHEITILEQSSGHGGRVRTVDIDGAYFDIGATVITPHLIHFVKKKLNVKIPTVDCTLDVVATQERIPLRFDLSDLPLKDLEKIGRTKLKRWLKIGEEAVSHLNHLKDKSALEYFDEISDMPPKVKAYLAAGFVAANVPIGSIEASALELLEYSHWFKYPKGGVGQIATRIVESFNSKGGIIEYNHKVESVKENESGVVIEGTDGSGKAFSLIADYVISNMGVKHSLGAIQGESGNLGNSKSKSAHIQPTMQPLQFHYLIDKVDDYKGRTGFVLYYPYDTAQEVNDYLEGIAAGKETIGGFYIHFPALIDPEASTTDKWPVSVWFPSQTNPSDEFVNRMQNYLEEQMSQYFIPDFKNRATLKRIYKPMDAIPYYNDPGFVSAVAPIVGYEVIEAKQTDRIFMTGSGVAKRFAPSTIQASMSGYKTARLIDLEIKFQHARGLRRLWLWLRLRRI
ncbi:MAG: phytoene desaturase family protein [Candidatus Kariarchaeaceae archaeon]|jgi:phytoene dehydrogenase-like protein